MSPETPCVLLRPRPVFWHHRKKQWNYSESSQTQCKSFLCLSRDRSRINRGYIPSACMTELLEECRDSSSFLLDRADLSSQPADQTPNCWGSDTSPVILNTLWAMRKNTWRTFFFNEAEAEGVRWWEEWRVWVKTFLIDARSRRSSPLTSRTKVSPLTFLLSWCGDSLTEHFRKRHFFFFFAIFSNENPLTWERSTSRKVSWVSFSLSDCIMTLLMRLSVSLLLLCALLKVRKLSFTHVWHDSKWAAVSFLIGKEKKALCMDAEGQCLPCIWV